MSKATLVKTSRQGKNQGWIQSEKRALFKMSKLGIQHPSAIPILLFIMSSIDRGSNSILISQKELANELGLSEKTVMRSIAVLVDRNYFKLEKFGNLNKYTLHSSVCWQEKRAARYKGYREPLLDTPEVAAKAPTEGIKLKNGFSSVLTPPSPFGPTQTLIH